MLHQIRKMVAIVVAIARNMICKETIDEAFKTMDKMDLPLAPSLGLCLCHVRKLIARILLIYEIILIVNVNLLI